MVWAVVALPCSGILGKDSTEHKWGRVGRGFLSLNQVLEGIAGRPLPTMEKNGVTVSFGYTRSRRFLVHTRPTDSFLLIPGHDVFLFIPGHNTIPCLYQGKHAIHTSVRGVMGASWAGITLLSDSWAVCASGAWASVIYDCGMVLGSEWSPAVQSPECPRPWEAIQHG